MRASIQPPKALCIPEKRAPRILPVHRPFPCWLSSEENRPWSETNFLLRGPLVRAFGSRAQGFSTLLARQRSSCPQLSSNLVLTRSIERSAVRLCVLRRPTRFSATVPPVFRELPPPEGHQIGTREEARAPGCCCCCG